MEEALHRTGMSVFEKQYSIGCQMFTSVWCILLGNFTIQCILRIGRVFDGTDFSPGLVRWHGRTLSSLLSFRFVVLSFRASFRSSTSRGSYRICPAFRLRPWSSQTFLSTSESVLSIFTG